MGISDRGTKAKSITSCDNAFVTNIGAADASLALRFRAKDICCWPETLQRSEAAHRTPPGSSALRESEATATKRPAGTEINFTLGEEPLQKSMNLFICVFQILMQKYIIKVYLHHLSIYTIK
ncbi:hypothetical protein ABH966_000945 [Lysinibacillus sp. RC46]|uniref:hypothetical protein n=1 Tax=Lysinibacillus sp. RC46 TaxID=3156295 RepID=UPI003511CB37